MLGKIYTFKWLLGLQAKVCDAYEVQYNLRKIQSMLTHVVFLVAATLNFKSCYKLQDQILNV